MSFVCLGIFAIGCSNSNIRDYPTLTPVPGYQPSSTATFPAPTAFPGTLIAPSPDSSPTVPANTSSEITPTSSEPLITLLFTGQIVPARCVQAAISEAGNAEFLYDGVRDLITQADVAVGTLNAALSDYPPPTGCVETFVLVGSPINAQAMADAGFDLMSVATNHIKNCGVSNCGDRTFLDTLNHLRQAGITPVGAGEDAAEARRPVVVELKGIRFAFISMGQIEPMAFAGPDSPGIAALTEASLISAIADARAAGEVVVVLPHWGPEYSHIPNASQLHLAEVAVQAGADLVIGNHTHYIQAFETILGIPVFYGLGNFIFDQNQEPARQQSLIVRFFFQGTRLVNYEIIPIIGDVSGAVRLAGQAEAAQILSGIQAFNDGLP